MNTKDAGTVVRVTDTIPPQFTPFQYVPGRRFHIRDLMPVGQATSNTIWMPYESAITNGIARVAENGAKPASDFTPAVVKWPVEKVATTIKFSEEILEDMPQFTSYLTTRWLELLKQAEDTKLLYGTGSNDVKGLTVTASAYVDILGDSKVDRYMILDAAVTQAQTAGFFPNFILLHPVDALKLRQTRDTTGNLIFPIWMGANPLNINGATVVIHPAMTQGDFLVGDMAMGCQLWDRKSANVKFYDQNEDDAKYNRILAVFEERLALVTYQSTAFVFGDFTSALAKGSA
jgi:HK97 family phage major capsid protein